MALEQIGLEAVLRDENFRKGLERYTSGIGQMTKITDGAASAISGAFKVATSALLIGVGGIGAVLATSVKAAADAEQIAAATDAVLQSTKGVAGMTADAIGDLATSLSELTPFEDDAIQGGENLLLTFTNIGKNVFPLATETMLDLSQAMGQDLKSSAVQLGKALNDPATGMSALQRVGVTFSKTQEDLIKKLVATGKTEEAQKVILKELQTEFGGAAKAAGKTFAGQLQILKNTLGNVQEEIGGALLPILTKLAGALAKALADPRVKSGIKTITTLIEGLGDVIGDLASGRGLNALFDFYFLMERLFGTATAKKIYNVLTAIGTFKDQMVALAGHLMAAFQAGGIGEFAHQLVVELQHAWPTIQVQLATWGSQFWTWLSGPGGALEQAGAQLGKIGGAIATWAQQNGPGLFAGLQTLASDFWMWLWGPEGALARTGMQLEKIMYAMKIWIENNANMQPVWNALMGWVSQFWGWVTDARGGLLVTVAEKMGQLAATIEAWSKDPATQKRFAEIGTTLARAILDGMGNLFSNVSEGDTLMTKLWNMLLVADKHIWGALMGIGKDISAAILSGIASIFTDPERATNFGINITNMMENAMTYVIGQLGGIIARLRDAWDAIISQFHFTMPWDTQVPSTPTYGPAYAQGGWVGQTGMALVHRGEYVIPARQAQNIVNNSRSIGAVTVNITGSTGMGESAIRRAVYDGITQVLGAA